MLERERQPRWDMLNILNFVCWVAAVALAAAFLLNLAVKWGIMEWFKSTPRMPFLKSCSIVNFVVRSIRQ